MTSLGFVKEFFTDVELLHGTIICMLQMLLCTFIGAACGMMAAWLGASDGWVVSTYLAVTFGTMCAMGVFDIDTHIERDIDAKIRHYTSYRKAA